MATLAEFTLPLDAFPLGVVCEEFPDATVELERVVPTADAMRQYVWVEHVPAESIATFLESQTDTAGVKLVDQVDDRTLFRYHSDSDGCGVLEALVDSDTTLLSATGTRAGWRVHVRGDVQQAVADFDERCRRAGVQPTLRDLHATVGTQPSQRTAVTDAQREALLLAYANGYYADPRETNLSELAAEVGISRQAFARRLSRGYRTLVESHLALPTADEGVS
ncbi:helix-turn-helix domain-containing protein [Haloarcula onubensis]|uniref:Helix-turn-helix domain-containing protein n=1 Tax=Haloarcula onubensis TaxID=2950539 RepID=A0ABU2FKE0_9EURY|nr:helix-turn-helix domain-containing protein [Halomicroarcula sp. S3CR25-11]MDS0281178.1 helix-turn-helix domain-containing protein [Halomicroarcula sp. S3CR25-11]